LSSEADCDNKENPVAETQKNVILKIADGHNIANTFLPRNAL